MESAIWLFEDPDAPTTIDWDKIRDLTNLGSDMGHRGAQIITLPDPLDTNCTTYEVSEDRLVVNLLPAFATRGPGMSIDKKGEKSFQWIVESHARSRCLVNWSAGNVDAYYLP